MVELGERVGVARGGQARPVRIGGVDRLLGLGGGVLRWGGSLAGECGDDEHGEGVAWAHSASPLGEGEENTGAAERSQAATNVLRTWGKAGPSRLRRSGCHARSLSLVLTPCPPLHDVERGNSGLPFRPPSPHMRRGGQGVRTERAERARAKDLLDDAWRMRAKGASSRPRKAATRDGGIN